MIIPPEVRNAWLSLNLASHFRPIAEGLSSSQVWQVKLPDSSLCLKALPNTALMQQRLTELHQFQNQLSSQLNFIAKIERTISGASYHNAQNHLWELSGWLPGAPLIASRATVEQGQAAMQAVAQMHIVSRKAQTHFDSSPAVTQRIEMLQRYSTRLPELIRASEQTEPMLRTLAAQTLRHFQASAERLETELARFRGPIELFWVLRDLHIEHMLFEGSLVTGVIDFGAARIDEPLTDLVRLLGSLWPLDRSSRHEMLKHYLQQTQITDIQNETGLPIVGDFARANTDLLKRFQLLDHASTLLSAMQWLQWQVVDRREFATDTGSLINRWQMLMDRLDLDQW